MRNDRYRRQHVPQGPAHLGDPGRRLAASGRVRRRPHHPPLHLPQHLRHAGGKLLPKSISTPPSSKHHRQRFGRGVPIIHISSITSIVPRRVWSTSLPITSTSIRRTISTSPPTPPEEGEMSAWFERAPPTVIVVHPDGSNKTTHPQPYSTPKPLRAGRSRSTGLLRGMRSGPGWRALASPPLTVTDTMLHPPPVRRHRHDLTDAETIVRQYPVPKRSALQTMKFRSRDNGSPSRSSFLSTPG